MDKETLNEMPNEEFLQLDLRKINNGGRRTGSGRKKLGRIRSTVSDFLE